MNAHLPWLSAPPPTGVRLRFAPSPTGELHIGGARTALFNYMMAKRLGGRFLLRIEDTDAARSTPENTQVILDGLRWLGLHWDEGPEVDGPCAPYLQSQRSALYQKAVDWLLEKDRLYPCFLTMDEIEAMRMQALHEKRNFVQESPYAAHDPAELKARAAAGEPHTLRFRCPEKTVVVHDLLRGEVSFSARDMVGDLIIRRSDGGFTYNFVVVVDDLSMGVSHVLRGDDHLSNTPKQVLLMEALGGTPPEYAHMPLILGMDGKKLSKRHGAASVLQYQQEGYLPQALVNFTALMGWHPEGDQEVLPFEELIKHFEAAHIKKSAARFDFEKLQWMNGVYVRQLAKAEYLHLAMVEMRKAGLVQDMTHRDEEILLALWERVRLLPELPDLARYFYESPSKENLDQKAQKELEKDGAGAILQALRGVLENLDLNDEQTVEQALRDMVEKSGEKPKRVFQLLRVAVTGRLESPPLFLTLRLVGRQAVLDRIATAGSWV